MRRKAADIPPSMMHVGLGRAHPLHIEYIHLGICLGFIQDIMTEAILSHPRLHLQRKIALVKALGKVIWIQNDLMAKWHVRDGEEYKDDEQEIVIEEEGYLHGKKVFTDSDEEMDAAAMAAAANAPESPSSPSRLPRPSAGAAPAGVCPFSGMVKGVGEMRVDDGDKTPTEASVVARELPVSH